MECQVKPQAREEIYKTFLKKYSYQKCIKNYYESIRIWQTSQQKMDKRWAGILPKSNANSQKISEKVTDFIDHY